MLTPDLFWGHQDMAHLDCAEQASPGLRAKVLGAFRFMAFWGVAGFVAMSLLQVWAGP
jgi:hypothetical protein